MKHNQKKVALISGIVAILIVILALAALYLILCFTKDAPFLNYAAVDNLSGDFSIEYNKNGILKIESYDKNGTFLFSIDFGPSETASGTADAFYKDGLLHVFIWRTNDMKVYDGSGKLIDEYKGEHNASLSWNGFDNKNGARTKTVGDTTYVYKETPFLKRAFSNMRNVFYIKNDTVGEKTIWDSKSVE